LKINLGRIRFVYNRTMSYWTIPSTFMSFLVFAKIVGFSWWYVLAIPALIFIGWLDMVLILPQEINFSYDMSKIKIFEDMMKEIKALREDVKKLKGES
jgi:hypothetical protein